LSIGFTEIKLGKNYMQFRYESRKHHPEGSNHHQGLY